MFPARYRPETATGISSEAMPAESDMNVNDEMTPMPKPPGKAYKVSHQLV
jgi:hypothetical protein